MVNVDPNSPGPSFGPSPPPPRSRAAWPASVPGWPACRSSPSRSRDRRDRPRPGPPFTYRLGQRPDREIRVNVKEFTVRNQTKTSNERQAAADQVPPSMVNDPAPIQDLADRLDDLTVTIAKSGRFEDLPETLRGCLEAEARDAISTSRPPPTRPSAATISTSSFSKAFRAALAARRARPRSPAPQRGIEPTLAIHDVGQPPASSHLVPRERVVPERIVKPGGAGQPGFRRGLHHAPDRRDPLPARRRPDRWTAHADLRAGGHRQAA